MRKILLDTLKFIWALIPAIIVWLFYILPLILTGSIEFFAKLDTFIWAFEVQKRDTWYTKRWRDWAGWAGPAVVLFRPDLDEEPRVRFMQVLKHEWKHCWQMFVWGVFFYPAYALNTAFIWLFQKDKHSYHDNYFERQARKFAGQRVDIPREHWMHGPDDRFPWL